MINIIVKIGLAKVKSFGDWFNKHGCKTISIRKKGKAKTQP